MKAWIAASAALMALATGAAQAGDVSWTVTVGSPRPAPRVIYAPPAVIYAPPPVVYHPAPVVYHQPAPVYYVSPGHAKKWHKHQHRYAYHPGAVYVVKGKGHRHHDDD
jgi:hypothetical protein